MGCPCCVVHFTPYNFTISISDLSKPQAGIRLERGNMMPPSPAPFILPGPQRLPLATRWYKQGWCNIHSLFILLKVDTKASIQHSTKLFKGGSRDHLLNHLLALAGAPFTTKRRYLLGGRIFISRLPCQENASIFETDTSYSTSRVTGFRPNK